MEAKSLSKLGLMLKCLRAEKQLSQTELATRANVHKSLISRLESGDQMTASLENLGSLAGVLGLEWSTLYEWGKTLAYPNGGFERERLIEAEFSLPDPGTEPLAEDLDPYNPLLTQLYNLTAQWMRETSLPLDDRDPNLQSRLQMDLAHITEALYHDSLSLAERYRTMLLTLSNQLIKEKNPDLRRALATLLYKLAERIAELNRWRLLDIRQFQDDASRIYSNLP